jgi:hypothetical protein
MPQELSEPGWRGLAAGCIAARVLAGRDENAAQIFVRGVTLALEAKVGDSLASELALMAVWFGHSYPSVDLTKALEHLAGSPGHAPYSTNLDRALRSLEDDDFDSYVLPLLNAVRRHSSERLIDRIPSTLRDRAERARDDVRADVNDNLELFELRRKLALKLPIDRASVINQWRERRSWADYAYILYLLGFDEDADPAIAGEAQQLLVNHPFDAPTSGPLLLAIELAQDAGRRGLAQPGDVAAGQQLATAVRYLQGVIDGWEGRLSIESTIDAYQILVKHSNGDRGKYIESLVRWDAFLQEREGLTRLPSLIAQGRHFLVVWHYFSTLNFWGLKTEPQCTPAEIASMGPGEIARRTQELAGDRRIRDPIVTINRQVRLAAEFMRDGHAAYRAGSASGAEDARARVDKVAAARLPALFKAMAALDSIPHPLRDMLQRHEHSLFPQNTST